MCSSDLPAGEPGRRCGTDGHRSQRADGVIDYLSRIDHQVKIRGFRIELGEIEARLQEQPQVQEAVVLAQEGVNGAQLVGYVVTAVSAADEEVSGARTKLRERLNVRLKEILPGYMVPTYLVFLKVTVQLPQVVEGNPRGRQCLERRLRLRVAQVTQYAKTQAFIGDGA